MGANLVTVAEYKTYAGISSNTQDDVITSIIPKASELVKSICRRTFIDYVGDAKVETYSGGKGCKIFLKEYPILGISSVTKSDDYGVTTTELVEFVDFVIEAEDGALTALNGEFPKRINGYVVSYTAGYETLPEDLKVAVLDLVTYYIKNDGSVHSPKAPGTNTVQIEYITSATLPAHIKRVLDLYTGSYD